MKLQSVKASFWLAKLRFPLLVELRLQALFVILLTVMFAGCYTKLGYYDTAYLQQEKYELVTDTGEETEKDANVQKPAEVEESEGYYGRRKPPSRISTPYIGDTYWTTYVPYWFAYYPVVPYYYPYPAYGYRRYYGYSAYYPYRWYRRSTYVPNSRRTYKNSSIRREHRRSRSVTSPRTQSERFQHGKTRNKPSK